MQQADTHVYSDCELEAEISRLHSAIESWARAKDLWHDCGFQTFAERLGAEPGSSPVVTILHFEGPLYGVFNGTFDDGSNDEFYDLVESLGYLCEQSDHVSMWFFAEDPKIQASFANYFRWQWICELIKPDVADVYEELYSHFINRPDDLYRLNWREFEILLFRIFQNQGFKAELGPGRGDGGVDIRLLQRDPIGDVLTLVQAKKYAPQRRIKLEAVAALYGIASIENAQKSIFVTTSLYEPGAKRFAARTSGALALKTGKDVIEWCKDAADGIVQDKSKLVSSNHVTRIIYEVSQIIDGRVIHANSGYDMTNNSFALVIKETRHAALLMSLPKKTISDDGYGQEGLEVPVLNQEACSMLTEKSVWRAKRVAREGRVSYWDGRRLYSAWDGQPHHFSWLD